MPVVVILPFNVSVPPSPSFKLARLVIALNEIPFKLSIQSVLVPPAMVAAELNVTVELLETRCVFAPSVTGLL